MSEGWFRWEGDTLVLELRVQPRASRDEVVGAQGGRLKVRVSAAPVDGGANTRLVELLAKSFKVPKSAVVLLGGAQAREKRIAVHAPQALPGWLPEA